MAPIQEEIAWKKCRSSWTINFTMESWSTYVTLKCEVLPCQPERDHFEDEYHSNAFKNRLVRGNNNLLGDEPLPVSVDNSKKEVIPVKHSYPFDENFSLPQKLIKISSTVSNENIQDKDAQLQQGTMTTSDDASSKTRSNKRLSGNDEIFKPKKKYPGFRRNFVDYFQEYTDYTGIHGFKYMGEKERSIFEKLSWVVLFGISLYFCISLIIQTWMKWDQSPVLVSFARSPTPVWQVPFPAVTICPETKSRQSVYNFTDAFDKYRWGKNMTEEEMKKFSDSSLICDNHLYTAGEKTTEFSTIEYLMSIAPQFEDVFFSCKWTLVNESCYNMFTPMLSEEGLCFTFNMLDKSELLRNKVFLHGDYMSHGRNAEGWNLESGYPANAKTQTFPRRAMSAGFSAGLFLVLTAFDYDLDYVCRGPVQGFKILLHHPAEIPRVGSQFFRAPLNQEIVVSVKPDMMTTSPGLRSYDPHRRQCFFPSEKYLSFYQSYTQQNCQVECLTNYTLAKCGCVAYHMPHEESTPICGSGSQYCMFEATTELLAFEVESGIGRGSENENTNTSLTDCDCLPACTSLVYNAETSQAEYEWQKVFQAFKVNFSELPGAQMTRLTLFFKEQQFITSERNELYGQVDFLANCGGILGLFTGFSFLSIVEIIYFLSLRLICNVKMYGRKYWSASNRLLTNDAYLHDDKIESYGN